MEKEEIVNLRYPHTVRITRLICGKADEADPFAPPGAPLQDMADVLYEGAGRSYTETTTQGNQTVDENKRKASIPVRYDAWGSGRKPTDGDTITAVIGSNVEEGVVYDCESDNNRTIVYWYLRRV